MKNESGQSLVEVIFAIGIMVFVLTSLTVAVLTALRNTDYSKNQNLATGFAQEGLEVARNMRDSDYASFKALTNHYCVPDDCHAIGTDPGCSSTGNTTCSTINVGTNFSRDVLVQHNSPDCTNTTKVVSTVSWNDGKCASNTLCRQVQVTSCYSNYNVLPTP